MLDLRAASFVPIQRAVHMADALLARLHVVLTLPDGTASVLPPPSVSHIADLIKVLRPRHGFHFEVVKGTVSDGVGTLATGVRPILVIVDPAIGARAVTRIAEQLQAPVLAARVARVGEVVAATDMRNSRFPVLSLARTYAAVLGRKVTYLHNATPEPVFVAHPMTGASTYTAMRELQNEVASAKGVRLRAFAGDPWSALVSRSGDTVDVILDLARYHDADLVVVGHRPRPWWRRMLRRGVAEPVVERSLRSVLVVPIIQ